MTLIPSHVFGANPKIRNNIIYLDYQTVIYSSGPHIVLYDELQKTQRFILINESGPITCMTANSISRVLAIAIKGSEADDSGKQTSSYVVVYDLDTLKKKKMLSVSHDEFTSIVFSKDAKYVFALTGDSGCTVFCWNIEKGKVAGSIRTGNQANPQMNEISINPFGRSPQICIIGNGILRVYKFEDPNFKLINQVKVAKNMICHSWVNKNRIVAGTDDSKLLVFESGEHILEIAYVVPTRSDQSDNRESKILSVESYSNGLVAGISSGVTVFFEKTDDIYLYKKAKEFLLEDSEVSTITVNPTEKNALVCLNNGQIYTLPIESDGKEDVVKADRFFSSFHYGAILGMDIASHKPLIITSGSDRSIRVWNYIENALEVIKYFPEEATTISLHPSGLYILAAFTNSIKLMTLLIDDIRPFWENNIPGCKECSFSNGGQFFAAVLGSTVQIYNTWSFRIAGSCKGSKAKIKSIIWSKDDKKLISTDVEGSLTIWNMQNFKNELLIKTENISYISAAFGYNSKSFLALASDSSLKEILDGKIINSLPFKESMTKFATSYTSNFLFGASSGGAILPIKNSSSEVIADQTTFTWHNGPITQIKISQDDQYLFTAGEDGLLWIYKNNWASSKKSKEWLFSNEILVTKSDLKESYKIMSELREKIEDMKSVNDSQQRMKDIAYQKKTSDAIHKYNIEINFLKEAAEEIVRERNKNAENHRHKIQQVREEHEKKLKEMHESFEEKFNAERIKFDSLKERQKRIGESAKKQKIEIEQMHQLKVIELSEYCKKKLMEKDDQIEQAKSDIIANEEDFYSGIKEIEEDIDQEYTGIQYNFAIKLKQEQDNFLKIKEENQKMRAEYDALGRLIESNKEEIVKMNQEDKKIRHIIKSMEIDIQGLRKEIQEREDTLLEKDKRILDLRKKNQELEKFKFVLDYKIIELRKQIEPKEMDIVALSTQIEEISNEIKDYGSREVILRNSLDDLRMKDRAVSTEKAAFIRKKETFQNLLKEIMRDVSTVWRNKDELSAVKPLIVSLFHKYSELNLDTSAIISSCGSQILNLGKNHRDPMEKHTSSRVALERTITVIESQKLKSKKSRFNEALRFTSENSVLKAELNYLTTTLQKTNQKILELNSALNDDPARNSKHDLLEPLQQQDSEPKLSVQELSVKDIIEQAIEDPFPQTPLQPIQTNVKQQS